jgi:hypothetical protein
MAVRRFLVVDDDCDDTELFAEAVESVVPPSSSINPCVRKKWIVI